MTDTQWSPQVYTVTEAAQMLRINRQTAYAMVHSGELRSIRVKGRIRIPRSAFDEFLGQASGGVQ